MEIPEMHKSMKETFWNLSKGFLPQPQKPSIGHPLGGQPRSRTLHSRVRGSLLSKPQAAVPAAGGRSPAVHSDQKANASKQSCRVLGAKTLKVPG